MSAYNYIHMNARNHCKTSAISDMENTIQIVVRTNA